MLTLPTEIQRLVLDHFDYDYSTLRECSLVCKSWNIYFQKILYSRISIRYYRQLTKLVDTLEKNQNLSSLVVKFVCYLKYGQKTRIGHLIFSKLFSCLTNLESITFFTATFFTPLLDALIANQLPNLNYICPPDFHQNDEDENYATCAFLLKDRLKNLSIWDSNVEEEDEDDSDFEDQIMAFDSNENFNRYNLHFYRLFDRLSEFKNIQELHISKNCDNFIELVEEAFSHNLPHLQLLKLGLMPKDINEVGDVDIGSATIDNISPMNNINQLDFTGTIHDYSQLMLYIPQKFLCVEKIRVVSGHMKQISLEDFVYNKFLDYLARIKYVDVFSVPCVDKNLANSVGPFWEKISRSCILHVQFSYNGLSTANLMDIHIENKRIHNKLSFSSSDLEFQHEKAIEKYGCNIDILQISFAESSFKKLILDPIKYCPKLRQLSLTRCTLLFLDLLDFNMEKKILNYLSLRHCDLNVAVFLGLTKQFSQISYLEIVGIEPLETPSTEYSVIEDINMNETDIGTLSLSTSFESFKYDRYILAVEISIKGNYSYYMYDFMDMSGGGLLSRINKEKYFVDIKDSSTLPISISCNSLKLLKVKHCEKVVTLKINE